jgi:hypothetical protein
MRVTPVSNTPWFRSLRRAFVRDTKFSNNSGTLRTILMAQSAAYKNKNKENNYLFKKNI